MSPPPRRRRCTGEDARTSCRQAVAYLETAKLVTSDGSLPADYDYNHVAAGVAVLAAIALAAGGAQRREFGLGGDANRRPARSSRNHHHRWCGPASRAFRSSAQGLLDHSLQPGR
jgi:hypothetical protein